MKERLGSSKWNLLSLLTRVVTRLTDCIVYIVLLCESDEHQFSLGPSRQIWEGCWVADGQIQMEVGQNRITVLIGGIELRLQF